MFKPVLKFSEMDAGILNYTPRPINHGVPTQVLPFMKDQKEDNSPPFTLSQMVSDQTGLSELEKKNFQKKVEAAVLQKLKEVEEKSYAEAYALGHLDGENKAFSESSAAIAQALESLAHLATELTKVKLDLVTQNEAQIMKMIYFIAEHVAMKAIATDEASILPVVKRAIESAQSEEEVTVRLNPLDQAFLERVKSTPGHPFERIQKMKLEVGENITRGGCIVETNYGLVDATLEQRMKKLWTALDEKIPKVSADD